MTRSSSRTAIWHCQWRAHHARGRAFTVAASRSEAHWNISEHLAKDGYRADIEDLRAFAPTEGPHYAPEIIARVLLEVGYRWIEPKGLNAVPQEIPYLVASLMRPTA